MALAALILSFFALLATLGTVYWSRREAVAAERSNRGESDPPISANLKLGHTLYGDEDDPKVRVWARNDGPATATNVVLAVTTRTKIGLSTASGIDETTTRTIMESLAVGEKLYAEVGEKIRGSVHIEWSDKRVRRQRLVGKKKPVVHVYEEDRMVFQKI